MSLFTCCAAPVVALAPAQAGQFEDPAPPQVVALEPVDSPAARDHAGLVIHAAPGRLAEDAVTEDWGTFLGPRRDGRSRETHLAKSWGADGPPLVWEMPSGSGFASPVIAAGRLVYTHRVGDESVVDCLDPETGRRFWRFTHPCEYRDRFIGNNGPRSSPTISEGRVYVHGVEGMLHCLELATGRVVWARNLSREFGIEQNYFGIAASPLVTGDLLIQNLGAPGGPCVVAFDKHTGRIVWGTGGEWGASCASPVLAEIHGEEKLFVLAGGDSRPPTGGLMVMDPESGTLDFTFPFRSKTYESVNGASPVVVGGVVFLTASYGVGSAALALNDKGGFEELWANRHVGIQFANPVFHEGTLYVIDGVSGRTGSAIGLDPATGEEVMRLELFWDETYEKDGQETTRSFSPGEGSLLFADGDFLCLGDSGHLLWLELTPEGGKVLARTWLFGALETWTPPVITGGLLYVRQTNRERFGDAPPRLLCYDLRTAH